MWFQLFFKDEIISSEFHQQHVQSPDPKPPAAHGQQPTTHPGLVGVSPQLPPSLGHHHQGGPVPLSPYDQHSGPMGTGSVGGALPFPPQQAHHYQQPNTAAQSAFPHNLPPHLQISTSDPALAGLYPMSGMVTAPSRPPVVASHSLPQQPSRPTATATAAPVKKGMGITPGKVPGALSGVGGLPPPLLIPSPSHSASALLPTGPPQQQQMTLNQYNNNSANPLITMSMSSLVSSVQTTQTQQMPSLQVSNQPHQQSIMSEQPFSSPSTPSSISTSPSVMTPNSTLPPPPKLTPAPELKGRSMNNNQGMLGGSNLVGGLVPGGMHQLTQQQIQQQLQHQLSQLPPLLPASSSPLPSALTPPPPILSKSREDVLPPNLMPPSARNSDNFHPMPLNLPPSFAQSQAQSNNQQLQQQQPPQPQATTNGEKQRIDSKINSISTPTSNASKKAQMESKLRNFGSWSSLAQTTASNSPVGAQPATGAMKVASMDSSFQQFKKQAKEKQDRQRQLMEQQEMRRHQKEQAERERQRAEREKLREKEEEEALEKARKSHMEEIARQNQEQQQQQAAAAAVAAAAQKLQDQQAAASAASSQHVQTTSEREKLRLREQERRRREAMAGQIDMNRQSDIMASFEGTL